MAVMDGAKSIGDDEAVVAWRADTPGCTRVVHLNNAGCALAPQPVVNAVAEHLRFETQIGGYEAADARAEAVGQAYEAIAGLVGGAPRNMAFVSSATAGFIQALASFDLGDDDVIVTSRSDYTSNQIQYLSLAKRRGIRVLHAADLPEGGVDPDSVRDLLGRTHRSRAKRIVALSWVPTNSGLVQDVETVGAVCEELGAIYVIDACQAVGQIPIDVGRLGCDYLSVTARKFLRGPRGVGFLFASDRALARGDHPLFVDMRGAKWVSQDRYDIADGAQRYEEWEHSYALLLGLGAAAAYARRVGVESIQPRVFGLADYLRDRLAEVPGARVLDRGRARCAIVTADIAGHRSNDLVAALRERRVNSSASLRRESLFDFATKQVEAAIRLSPHYYNTVAELDAAVNALRELTAAKRT